MVEMEVQFLLQALTPMETEFALQVRAPPTNVAREARVLTAQNVAGRVKVEPSEDGWTVTVDGRNTHGRGPPVDIGEDQWDENRSEVVRQNEWDDFVDSVKEITESRSRITPTQSRADASGFWRLTINYDDPRLGGDDE